MSNGSALGLAQHSLARPVDPEKLEQFGKQAAAMYKEKGTPLSDAVVEIVKEAKLAPEQVKRVCEFANTAAYLDAFEKAGNVRNVTFDGGPADPRNVLQDLFDGSSPTLLERGDYTPPVKTASAVVDLFANLFQYNGKEKTASVHTEHANPLDDLYDMKIALTAVHDELTTKLATAGILLGDVVGDLMSTAREEVLNGASVGDIVGAWNSSTNNGLLVKKAAHGLINHLVETGMDNNQIPLEKKASAAAKPNPEHPLLVKFAAYEKAEHAVAVLNDAILETDKQLSEIKAKLSGYLS